MEPLRVRALIEPGREDRWRLLLRRRDLFARHGLEWVEDSSADLLLANQKVVPPARNRHAGPPIVVLHRGDAASLWGEPSRRLARRDDVLAVFKNTVLRPRGLHNESGRRYHWKRIAATVDLEWTESAFEPLSATELEKIACVLWDTELSFLRYLDSPLLCAPLDPRRPRSIDLHCVLNARPAPGHEPLWRHRQRALAVASRCRSLHVVAKDLEARPLPFRRYIESLLDARVCVSPWGFGEFCYRDVEAMLAGAVLIKPRSDFVATRPDLYRAGRTYVACRDDFEDLEERAHEILGDWPRYDALRRRAREAIVRHPLRRPERYVEHVARAIRRAWRRAFP